MEIYTHRIYDSLPDNLATYRRILVDRIWPRGISKERASLDYWAKDIAPSHELRKWYQHDHDKWSEFLSRYHAELDENQSGVNLLIEAIADAPALFLFSSKEKELNNALALKLYLGAS